MVELSCFGNLDRSQREFPANQAHGMAGEFAVKRKRSSVEQIVTVLKQAELGLPLADLIRQATASRQAEPVALGRRERVADRNQGIGQTH